ncbi:MAG: thermonuclease family protein [Brachymonas sp.]|nr:thermonuclease family protein [Brachymonas sp.]
MLASTLLCLVVGVADGDSLLARCNQAPGYVQTQVRIAAIDAPEKHQPYGHQAQQTLAALCHRQQATIHPKEIDRYGRVVADVLCQGQDAAQHLLSHGMAWVYGRYAKGYGHLYLFEEEAQTAQRGLWADATPVPPWQWASRKQQRQPRAVP